MEEDRGALETALLSEVATREELDSRTFAAGEVKDGRIRTHAAVQSACRSLESAAMLALEEGEESALVLTEEGAAYAEAGSPEYQLLLAVCAMGGSVALAELKKALGNVADVGVKQAMQLKWIAMSKQDGVPTVSAKTSESDASDAVRQQLHALASLTSAEAAVLKKRKLVKMDKKRYFVIRKGEKFALQRKQQLIDMSQELLASGAWRGMEVKEYNFKSLGVPPSGGHLHPLLKVRTQFREIFLQMGFEEMPTNNFVESSFWNFDALFQPQMHPARDAHDTFFISDPALSQTFPEDYLERVKQTHERGGYGSCGYGYDWKRSEAQKNLLRTHTTAVSSRMLYRLAQDPSGFRPKKMFSIDRVFRNEAIDKTHLAEFHQIEGVCVDRGLCLGDLIGLFEEFFGRLGMPKLKFKPAFNPYTEPSMEIFAYHEGLGTWLEVGNSGMFRPEMLQPMGLPPEVNAIAWGLSLERPTMILYGIDNIRELFGSKVDLNMVQHNPVCRLGM